MNIIGIRKSLIRLKCLIVTEKHKSFEGTQTVVKPGETATLEASSRNRRTSFLELGIRIFVHSKNQFMGGWQKSR